MASHNHSFSRKFTNGNATMNRLQGVLVTIAVAVVLLAIPAVHVLALMDALPVGEHHADCGDAKNPGQR